MIAEKKARRNQTHEAKAGEAGDLSEPHALQVSHHSRHRTQRDNRYLAWDIKSNPCQCQGWGIYFGTTQLSRLDCNTKQWHPTRNSRLALATTITSS